MHLFKALIALIIIVAVLGVAALGGAWLWMESEMTGPGPHVASAEFTIERGDGLSVVADRLEEQGLVTRADLLKIYARAHSLDTGVKAGTYVIAASASAAEILNQLVEGDVKLLRLTIPEGLTTAQIIRRVRDSDLLVGSVPEEDYVEGTFLPDTYVFESGTTRGDFLSRMQIAQSDLIDELWPTRQEGLPITTPEEAVILASVVEKETGLATERPLIAGLFTARLKRGMRLESDPTVIYGVSGGEPLFNRYGERRTLYRSELDRKTDWNTYEMDGLPRTPICNPGRDAIAAVLQPPDTNYVFFVADGTGGHLFAETYAEHRANVAVYRAYEREEIARERGE
ncbi:MAG: endolytic transglycosylase MltG [Pseudomonadota bacterium]